LKAQAQGCRIAFEGELDGLAGQGLGLTLKQRLHRLSRTVSRPARPTRRVAGLALDERAAALFLLFFLKIFSHRYLALRRNPLYSASVRREKQRRPWLILAVILSNHAPGTISSPR